jgi:hypothetical protein
MSTTEGKGSSLLEFHIISSVVETVPGEFYVLRCHSGNLRRRAKILTRQLYLSVKYKWYKSAYDSGPEDGSIPTYKLEQIIDK